VFVRVGRDAGSVYLDLADGDWRVIEVGKGSWAIRDESPVVFVRSSSTLALPEPEPGGSIEELRRFVNVPDEASWKLLVAFLVMSLQPQGPFPILVLLGEQGSAKSTTARIMRMVVDPAKALLRAGAPSERDLMIAASRHWLIGFDNLSRVTDRLSDALCQLSTGAGFATRQLYSDDEEIVFEAMRPLILNGIAGIAQRPDLVSRALVMTLMAVAEDAMMPEKELWPAFEEARPRILGALLDTLAAALSVLPDVQLARSPRLADFARLGVAVEQVLEWEPGSFLAAFETSQSGALRETLDAELITDPVIEFARRYRVWEGTMTSLLGALEVIAEDDITHRKEWPPNAAELGKRLRRLAPALRKLGVEVDEGGEGRDRAKRRGIAIRAIDPGGDGGDGGDGR
jgi:hypothetical protein